MKSSFACAVALICVLYSTAVHAEMFSYVVEVSRAVTTALERAGGFFDSRQSSDFVATRSKEVRVQDLELFRMIVFVWCMYDFYNPQSRGAFMVPFAYSVQAYREAARYDNVFPEEIIAMVIAEHGGRYPYRANSVGKANERGLMQLSMYWVRRYNKEHNTSYTSEDLFDWQINMHLGAYAISAMKHTHENSGRCSRKVPITRKNSKGHLVVAWQKPKHTWVAHYRCAPRYREKCPTKYRDELIVKLSKWRDVLDQFATIIDAV